MDGTIDCFAIDSANLGKKADSFLLGVTTTCLNSPILDIIDVPPRRIWIGLIVEIMERLWSG